MLAPCSTSRANAENKWKASCHKRCCAEAVRNIRPFDYRKTIIPIIQRFFCRLTKKKIKKQGNIYTIQKVQTVNQAHSHLQANTLQMYCF